MGLNDTFGRVEYGDLSTLEAMLMAQATALQTMFASLAPRTAMQKHVRPHETFMGLALKAQAQSRATLSTLVDLEHFRQVMFVKQANIAHGPQQVNNAAATGDGPERSAQTRTHIEQTQPRKNELSEEAWHGSTHMDIGAMAKATQSHPAVKPQQQSGGPKSEEGKAAAGNAWTGGDWRRLRQAIKALNQAMRRQQDWLA